MMPSSSSAWPWRDPAFALPTAPLSLSEIWDLRNQGLIDDAYDAFLNLLLVAGTKANFSSVVDGYKAYTDCFNEEDALDLLMLEVSFARHRLDFDWANSRHAGVWELCQARSLRPHFQIYMQAALNALGQSRHAVALDRFLDASRYARNVKEHHTALLNWILCLENLGYDYKRHFHYFEESLRPHAQADWVEKLLSRQLAALRARCAFRSADIATLTMMLLDPPSGAQTRYTLAWLLACPLFGLPPVTTPEALMVGQESLKDYVYPYRLRTIKGLLIEEDLRSEIRVAEQIERFYLWTWRWLLRPDATTIDRVIRIRKKLDDHRRSQLTAEDFHLLENASRWLSLFMGITDTQIRNAVAVFSSPSSNANPFLEAEGLLLDYLFARRDGKETIAADTLAVLKGHPLLASEDAPIVRLLDQLRAVRTGDSLFGDLTRSLADTSELSAESQTLTDGILVNVRASWIRVFQDGLERDDIKSVALTQLLYLFSERDCINVREVLKACFSVKSYDPFVHDPKVANFIARANRLFKPWCVMTRRDDRIYMAAPTNPLRFVSANRHALQISKLEEAYNSLLASSDRTEGRQHKSSAKSLSSSLSSDQGALHAGWVTRKALEAYLNVSRATALRMMNRWLQDGRLTKKGVGKASRYRIEPSLQKELLNKVTKEMSL